MIDNLFSYEMAGDTSYKNCTKSYLHCQLKVTIGDLVAGQKIARIDLNFKTGKLEIYKSYTVNRDPIKIPFRIII
jgi:hypothetical protein